MIAASMNFGSIVVAGLIAGYVMTFIGYWMEGFLKLPRVDSTDQGLIYLGDDTPARWWIGMVAHEANSVLFGLVYAGLVYAYLPGVGWLRGLIFGALLWLAVSAISLVAQAGGAKAFQAMPKTMPHIAANLLLHLVYGFMLGILYLPA